jgi:hypothetical protein
VRKGFKAVDQFYDQLDHAHESARPARLKGRHLSNAVANAFGEAEANQHAEEKAEKLAVKTLTALAKSYKQREDNPPPASGLDISGIMATSREEDPLEVLLATYDDYLEDYPTFGPTLVAALAQLGAAAILQLGKEVDQPPKAVVRALIEKYLAQDES